MTALDHARATSTPAWSAVAVRERLIEAFQIERRLPERDRPRRPASTWPAKPIYEFADLVSWTDASERVQRAWAHGDVLPDEITRMDQTVAWLQWVPLEERRALAAWADAKACRRPVRKVLRRGGWSVTTFYRARDNAVTRIVHRLNSEGVRP